MYEPDEGDSIPARILSRVVFPIPFGPTRAIRARLGMLKDMSEKIISGSYDFDSLVADTIANIILNLKILFTNVV